MPSVQISFQHVLPIQEEHVVLGIHAYAAQASNYPPVRQRFGPRRIELILRYAALRPHSERAKKYGRDHADKVFHIRSFLSPPARQTTQTGMSIVEDWGQECSGWAEHSGDRRID